MIDSILKALAFGMATGIICGALLANSIDYDTSILAEAAKECFRSIK